MVVPHRWTRNGRSTSPARSGIMRFPPQCPAKGRYGVIRGPAKHSQAQPPGIEKSHEGADGAGSWNLPRPLCRLSRDTGPNLAGGGERHRAPGVSLNPHIVIARGSARSEERQSHRWEPGHPRALHLGVPFSCAPVLSSRNRPSFIFFRPMYCNVGGNGV